MSYEKKRSMLQHGMMKHFRIRLLTNLSIQKEYTRKFKARMAVLHHRSSKTVVPKVYQYMFDVYTYMPFCKLPQNFRFTYCFSSINIVSIFQLFQSCYDS